jgi:hypothetical protein
MQPQVIDLEKYNVICKKFEKAVEKANNEIAMRGCLEIEIASLKEELKKAYREISEYKRKK